MADLKRTDVKLLSDALKSNGGGVRDYFYADTTILRLIKAGLVQWKPNSNAKYVSLLTITPAGREALRAATEPKE